jgi:hypothetical protein
MRIKFQSKRFGLYFFLLVVWLIFFYSIFLIFPGSTVQGGALVISLCWSAPCIFFTLFMVYRKNVWLEAKGSRSERTEKLAWGIPIVVGITGLIIAIPIASHKYSQRCSAFEPNHYFVDCDLTNVDISNTDLHDSNFDGVVLDQANLSGSDLKESIFYQASLQGANLSNADLRRTDTVEANLSGANLSGANLTNADFSNANLSGVDLTGATLDNANFAGVDLHDATGLTNEMLASLSDWRGLVLEDRNQIIEAVGAACRGEPVAEAMPYTSGYRDAQYHPLILLNGQGEHYQWTHWMPRRWWPTQTSQSQLVACVDGPVTEKRYCNYEDGISIEYTRHGIEIRLVAVQTAQQVRSFTVWRDITCPSTTSGEPGQRKTADGAGVRATDVRDSLGSYININGEIEPLTIDPTPPN